MIKNIEKGLIIAISILLGILITISFLFIKNNTLTGNAIYSEKENWFSQEDIQIKEDAIILSVNNPQIISYSDVRSMEPYLTENSIGILIKPNSTDLKVGDVILFKKGGNLVSHRITELGTDISGRYYLTQGDNNQATDGKIRFEDIKGVLIGILY